VNQTTCPAEDAVLLDQLGELKVHDSRALAEHEATCPACRQRRAQVAALIADLGAVAAATPDDSAAFRARVLARLTPGAAVVPLRRRLADRWRSPLLAAAAAALLVAPAAVLLGGRMFETVTARGGAAPAAPAAELRLVRARRMVDPGGQTLGPGDALAVRAVNGGARPVYLMAFARDAAGEVHWFYPDYRDPGTDPPALAIDAHSPWRVLPDLVLPERPAAGPLRLVTALFSAPPTVKQIEQRLAGAPAGAALAPLLPPAVVREWTARWPGPTPEGPRR
jgi:hypothetical protein